MYKLLETQIQPKKLGTKNLEAKLFNKIWRTKLVHKIYEYARTSFWNKIREKNKIQNSKHKNWKANVSGTKENVISGRNI